MFVLSCCPEYCINEKSPQDVPAGFFIAAEEDQLTTIVPFIEVWMPQM